MDLSYNWLKYPRGRQDLDSYRIRVRRFRVRFSRRNSVAGSKDDDQEGRRLWTRFRGERRTPPRSACPDPNALGAYLDGKASGEEAREVEAHLASCASCLEALEDVRSIQDAGEPRVPEALLERAKMLIPGPKETPVLQGYFKRAAWLAAAAAVVAAVCFAGYSLGQDFSGLDPARSAFTEFTLSPVHFSDLGV